MNKQKISAKPREASKAPLSPRGKASKKTTTTSAENRAEIKKTISDILDKKLAQLREALTFDADYSLLEADEITNGSKTAFRAAEAVPVIYDQSEDLPHLVLQPGVEKHILGGICRDVEDFKDYCENAAKSAKDFAERISNRGTELGEIIEFLNTKDGGLFRREIVDRLLRFPRIVVEGEEVRIGGLQLYANPPPGNQREEDALAAKARAPFDALVHYTRQYIALAANRYTTASANLLAVITHLDDLAEALGIFCGGRSEAIVAAARNAVNAAKLAQITLESNPLCIFADEVNHLVANGESQGNAIISLLETNFANVPELQGIRGSYMEADQNTNADQARTKTENSVRAVFKRKGIELLSRKCK